MANFTGQNIQDSYQRVLQVDDNQLQNGTGSNLPISFDGNNVIVSGSIIANEYIVSSSITNITIATLSGSTEFGDTSDDTHNFTGSIFADGNITSEIFNSTGKQYKLNGDKALYLDSTDLYIGNNQHKTYITSSGIVDITGNITSSGNISASGNIYSANEDAISWTFQTAQASATWYGPNRQGLTYYYWNKSYGNDVAVQTLDWSSGHNERNLNSGWRIPYRMEITRIHFYGHNAQTASAAEGESYSTTASLLVGSPEDGAPGNSSLALTTLGTIISNIGESRYAAHTASLAINYVVSESQFVYPRLKSTAPSQAVNGTYTIYYKRVQ